MTNLESTIPELQEILEMVNALPEAGGGEGGAAVVKTGTFTLTEQSNAHILNHGLGAIPEFFACFISTQGSTTGNNTLPFMLYYNGRKHIARRGSQTSALTFYRYDEAITEIGSLANFGNATTENIQLGNGVSAYYVQAGKELTWIVMAGLA